MFWCVFQSLENVFKLSFQIRNHLKLILVQLLIPVYLYVLSVIRIEWMGHAQPQHNVVILKWVFTENLVWNMVIEWKPLFSYFMQSVRVYCMSKYCSPFPRGWVTVSFLLYDSIDVLLFIFLIFIYLFQNRVSLCRPGWPGTRRLTCLCIPECWD